MEHMTECSHTGPQYSVFAHGLARASTLSLKHMNWNFLKELPAMKNSVKVDQIKVEINHSLHKKALGTKN